MFYEDGRKIQIGDRIEFAEGKATGIVVEIIEQAEEQRSNGVNEPGVMLESGPACFVFLPVSSFTEEALSFVSTQTISN